MDKSSGESSRLKITDLLRPHSKLLIAGLIAVVGEGIANLLQPWPLKIVLDNVLKSREIHGWLNSLIQSTTGGDKLGALRFAAVAVLVIALVDALCSYN